MTGKMTVALALGAVTWACTGWAQQDDQSGTVVRYVGTKTGTAWARPCLLLVVAPRQGGGAADLVVPNRDPEARKFDPDPTVVEVVKKLKPGDLLQIRTSKLQGHQVLNFVQPYHPQPGEDDPYAFGFVQTIEGKISGQDSLGVSLSKGQKSQTVWLPNYKDKEGKWTPDEELAAAVKGFKKGDIVEVRLQSGGANPILKSISPYKPPEKAEFVKSLEQTVGEVTYLAAEVKKDGDSLQLLVPARKNERGEMVRDAELVGKVRALKAGQVVEFKSRQQGGQRFLVDVRATGERVTSRPVQEKPKGAAD
jgi:hypothetical protein